MQAATGRQPAELATPPCPVSLAPLFAAFVEMSSARGSGFGSPQPVGWADMQAWARLTGTPLDSFDARVLRLLDAAWIKAWADAQPASETTPAGAGRTTRSPQR